MKMAELKTKKTAASVAGFLKNIADPVTRGDCETLVAMMKSASKCEPKLWGSAIIGFGNIRLKYDSGRELDWFISGFSPRKGKLSLYLAGGLEPLAPLFKQLGQHDTGKGCLYIKRLADIHLPTLRKIVAQSMAAGKKKTAAAG
jgi:hypothetical protein